MGDYPRFITSDSNPFDPLRLAEQTKAIVSKGNSRKYTDFYCTGVYGGISTGYTVGCCLRCIFCWVDWSRDFPESFGRFYSPEQVAENLLRNSRQAKVNKLRISGGEPTISKEHLLEVLNLVKDMLFILETNGLILGADKEFIESLEAFKNNLYIRVSLKAGTPEGFLRRTGAKAEFFELPFEAIQLLIKSKLRFQVATMSDPVVMPEVERSLLIKKLKAIGYKGYLEEELCDPYPHAIQRLKYAGFKLHQKAL